MEKTRLRDLSTFPFSFMAGSWGFLLLQLVIDQVKVK